jgi:hypothetical protein
MQVNVLKHAGKVHCAYTSGAKALSISTDIWQNKHRFMDHWSNRLPSEKIDSEPLINLFPEIRILCESLKATSQKV